MPHHVLHILQTAQPEGAGIAKIVSGLARGLDPQRYRLHAWFLGGDGPLARELLAAGAEVRIVPWSGIRRDPAGAWRFWRCLLGEEFSIIHQHSGGRSVRWLARGASRATLILHLHGGAKESEGTLPVARQVWDADVVLATSRAAAEVAVGLRPYVVYPGVQVAENSGRSEFSGTTAGSVIGTAGRLVPIKGLTYLVRALASLRDEVPDIRLEIAGSGPEREPLEKEVHSLRLTDHVTFLGWQRDLEAVMPRWGVFVLPSLEEGFGMAALEAMAAGLPVVATAVGGLPELVEDGRTGWLVPPADSDALAGRLRTLLLHPELRRALGAAGRTRARQHFSMDQMVARIAEIYDRILDRSGQRQ